MKQARKMETPEQQAARVAKQHARPGRIRGLEVERAQQEKRVARQERRTQQQEAVPS